MFFGLSMRQCGFSLAAMLVAVGLYFLLKPYSYYIAPLEELEGVDLSNNNDEIQAIAQVGSVEYLK